MAHGLKNNRSMFYAGEVPWHGLGIPFKSNITWQEASAQVGFYEVVTKDVYVEGNPDKLKSHKALTRGDDGSFLAVVGKDYGVVDFADLAEAVIVAAGSEAVFHTGGMLGRNQCRGWLLGELGEPLMVKGDASPIRKYFLATTSHDGGNCATLMDVATRVVCQNTLGAALGEQDGHRWSIRHTKNAQKRVEEAAAAFRNLSVGYEKFGELANLMAATRFSENEMRATVDELLPLPKNATEAGKALGEKREQVMGLFDHGTGIEGAIRGTAWAAFQAWTEYADHHRTVRAINGKNEQVARLESIWFGGAADLKARSLHAVAELAGLKIDVRVR